MFWAEIWKMSEFLSENFQFLEVKFSIYLNRRVFVMLPHSFWFWTFPNDCCQANCLVVTFWTSNKKSMALTPFAELFVIYSRISLSRIPRDSLKHFEISVPRHIRVERVRKTINWTTTFNKWICNLTPEVRNIYIKIMWKKKMRNCS